MSPVFLVLLAGCALLVWALGSYFFWRIDRTAKSQKAVEGIQPALRLADSWIAESQERIGKLMEESETPLSTAQHELLDLRLEATRLPQGIKSLGDMRESLSFSMSPRQVPKCLAEIVDLYLEKDSYREKEPVLVYLKTPLGEMPCLEAVLGPQGPTEASMKSLLAKANGLDPNPAVGGILYFGEGSRYLDFSKNPEWMEGLKSRRLMAVDFKGLTALLMSLRLSLDTAKLVEAFEEGVKSTLKITGQSEKMGESLALLNSRVLKMRAVLEGSPLDGLTKEKNLTTKYTK